jgi:ribosomal protein S18 acetylase RimI-like enzyme
MTITSTLTSQETRVEVRTAARADLPQILEVLDKLSRFDDISAAKQYSPIHFNFERILRNDDYNLAVAVVKERNTPSLCYEKVVSTAMLLVQINLTHNGRPYGHIENVVTLPEYRNQGFARMLVNHLINVCKSRDCYKIILDCKEENMAFYKKVGFEGTGEMEMRYNITPQS